MINYESKDIHNQKTTKNAGKRGNTIQRQK